MTRPLPPRILAAGLSIAALTATALIVPATAQAAASPNRTVSGATLNWQLNPEVQGAAFFGGCQYFSAGQSDGTTTTYAASAGNVSVKQGTTTPTYATRCGFVGGGEQHVEFGGGTGTLNIRTGATKISWTGSWSVNFYGGLAPFWIKNPVLSVTANGAGTVKATIGGYASSQDNPTVKTPITPVDDVIVAKLAGVGSANASGFTVTPTFAGVKYNAPSGAAPQDRTSAGWGAWPKSFVDVHQQTGLSSYWYSSGSSTDAKKPPLPITVGYGTLTRERAVTPKITVTPQHDLADGDTITVTGTGFDTTTPNQHGPGVAGLYVELGWSARELWKPSEDAPAASRSFTTAIWVHDPTFGSPGEALLGTDGSFSVSLPIDRAALEAKQFDGGKLSVFTVAGGGAVSAGSEARKFITLAEPAPTAPAKVTLAQPSLPSGGTITMHGNGFSAGEGVSAVITTAGTAARTLAPVAAGEGGSFTAKRTLPSSVAAGAHRLVVTGDDSGRSARVAFAVTSAPSMPNPTPTPTPTDPAPSCTISDGVTAGSLVWGFKESFRRYVSSGPAENAITASDGATVLSDGSFRWALTDGDRTDATHYTADFGGSVLFHYPAHFFDLTIAEPRLVVSGTTGTLYADVTTARTGPGAPTTTTHDGTAFARVDLTGAERSTTRSAFDVTGIGVTLADASAFSFDGTNFYQQGEPLDDAALALLGCDGTSGDQGGGTGGGDGAGTGSTGGDPATGGADGTDLVPEVAYRPESLGDTGVPTASLLGLALLLLTAGGAVTGAARLGRTATHERIGR